MEALARMGQSSIMRRASWLNLTPVIRGSEDREYVLSPPYTMIHTVANILKNITDTACLSKALKVLLKSATDCTLARTAAASAYQTHRSCVFTFSLTCVVR